MSVNNDSKDKNPPWVLEVRKEIKRLERKIDSLQRRAELGEVNEIDALEDQSNWEGWAAALRWALKMREGTTTRRAAWGRS